MALITPASKVEDNVFEQSEESYHADECGLSVCLFGFELSVKVDKKVINLANIMQIFNRFERMAQLYL